MLPRHYSEQDDIAHLELLKLAASIQASRGYDKRHLLHREVLEASGKDEELVDAAVLEFCLAENSDAHAHGQAIPFPGVES